MRRFYFLLIIFLYSPVNASWWRDLWWRADQQAATALKNGDPAAAAKLFHNPAWRGVAEYRQGNYQKALSTFNQNNNAVSLYNQGNALAHLQRLDDAIHAYDLALQQQPNFPDAVYNRDLLKKLKQQQKKQKQNQKQNKREQHSDRAQQQNKDQQQQKQDQKQQQQDQQQAQSQDQKQQSQEQKQQSQSPQSSKQNQSENTPSQKQSIPQAADKTDPTQKKAPDQNADTPDEQTSKSNPSSAQSKSATNQALQRIPDDPGNLLQQIFLRDYLRRHGQAEETAEEIPQ